MLIFSLFDIDIVIVWKIQAQTMSHEQENEPWAVNQGTQTISHELGPWVSNKNNNKIKEREH